MPDYVREVKKYLSEIRQAVDCPRYEKKKFIREMESNIWEFTLQNLVYRISAVREHFGEPEDIAAAFMEETVFSEADRISHQKKMAVKLVLLASLALGVVALVLSLSNRSNVTISENGYYLLPESADRLLTYLDIQDFTTQDLMLARNEIYARHGLRFEEKDVRTYFEAQPWYRIVYKAGDFETVELSDIEQKNVEFLLNYEKRENGVKERREPEEKVRTYGGYILPRSAERLLTAGDLEPLTKRELELARNEIYARHGRRFADPDIQAWFDEKDWYSGTVEPGEFDPEVLSNMEQRNIEMIGAREAKFQTIASPKIWIRLTAA